MRTEATRRQRALVIIPAAGALIASTLVGTPAVAAVAAPVDCPDPLPTASAVKGLTGTGFTVSEGTEPDPFTATVLGRITDGIGPGVDMIMAELDSDAIEAAGGVWAGMSGSPVYTDDGELIGAVSYGLAASSPIAGLTPAATMTPLLTGDVPTSGLSAGDLPARVKVTSAQAKTLAKAGDLSVSATSRGFSRLTLPLGVSGAPSTAGKKILDRFEKKLDAPVVLAGSGTASRRVDAQAVGDVHAGGNFAGVLSYGSASFYGVGTTTFVCDGRAVAFGHPFDYVGETHLGAALADTIYVQPDPTWGPFKVTNITDTVGVVDFDSLTGIAATLGAGPTDMLAVRTTLTNPAGQTFTGATDIADRTWTSDIAAYATLFDVERALGASSPGSASLTIRITGKRADGSGFSITRADKYVSTWNLPYAVADTVYALTSMLKDQDLEKVTLTGVRVTGTVSRAVKGYKAAKLRIRSGGAWRGPGAGPFPVTSGGTLKGRILLTRLDTGATTWVAFPIAMPKVRSGASGQVTVSTGSDPWWWWIDADTFPELVAGIKAQPPGAAITAQVDLGVKSKTSVKLSKLAITEYENGAEIYAR